VVMVETTEAERATKLLEDTQNGTLEPIEEGVEDPELKDAPLINLDEEEAKKAKAKPELEESDPVVCPMCDSHDIELKTAFFSTKAKLRCGGCGHKWEQV
jgi:hypothetical protein